MGVVFFYKDWLVVQVGPRECFYRGATALHGSQELVVRVKLYKVFTFNVYNIRNEPYTKVHKNLS